MSSPGETQRPLYELLLVDGQVVTVRGRGVFEAMSNYRSQGDAVAVIGWRHPWQEKFVGYGPQPVPVAWCRCQAKTGEQPAGEVCETCNLPRVLAYPEYEGGLGPSLLTVVTVGDLNVFRELPTWHWW